MKPQFSILKFVLIALAICPCFASQAPAQSSNLTKPITANGNNCESNKAYWDLVAVEANENSSTIIVIARLGDGERARRLNHRRLHNLFTYLNYIREIALERLVRADGERVRGLGRVEAYINGKLFIVFTVGRNQDLQGGELRGRPKFLVLPGCRGEDPR